MEDMGIIRGAIEAAIPLEITKNIVYIRENIQPTEIEGIVQYQEYQYKKDEYLQIICERQKELEDKIAKIEANSQ